MKITFYPDRKQERAHLLVGHIQQILAFPKPSRRSSVEIRSCLVMTEITGNAGSTQGWLRARWGSATRRRRKYLVAIRIHHVVIAKGAEQIGTEASGQAGELWHFAAVCPTAGWLVVVVQPF